MHTFLKIYLQSGKYSSPKESYQAELQKKGKFIDQKSLSISDLQIDYLNLYNSVKKIQGALAVEDHTHLINALGNNEG